MIYILHGFIQASPPADVETEENESDKIDAEVLAGYEKPGMNNSMKIKQPQFFRAPLYKITFRKGFVLGSIIV